MIENPKKRSSLAADLLLLLVAVIWGGGFPVVQFSVDAGLSALMILFGRFTVATVIMGTAFRGEIAKAEAGQLKYGITAGVILFLGFFFQTVGIQFTTPSNNALLTSTNVVMVPFIAWFLMKMRPRLKHVLMTGLCFVGAMMLAYKPGTGISFNTGDLLTLLCAFMFALHIAYIGATAKNLSPLLASFLQFATAAVLSGLFLLLTESDRLGSVNLKAAFWPILYLGALSTGLCFFLQSYAQQKVSSSRAAMILSMESVFGSLFSVLLGLEPLRVNLILGGGIMVASVILMETDFSRLFRKKREPEKEKPGASTEKIQGTGK